MHLLLTLKKSQLLKMILLMLQSGILIPVDERSETTIFDTVLTDIGDNQSIENQLSTYIFYLIKKYTQHFGQFK